MHRQLLDQKLPPHPLGPFVPKRARRVDSRPSLLSCRGGHSSQTPMGYILEGCSDHPLASGGMMMQHRLVAKCHMGRLLAREEKVHHENRNKADNRWENLHVTTNGSEHGRLHAEDTRLRHTIPITEDQVREALAGRTTLEAAAHLGVSHQTLRYRFDHLLTKRRTPGTNFPAEIVRRIRNLALDPRVSTRAACATMSMSALTIRKCCMMNGIEWVRAVNRRGPGRDVRVRPESSAPVRSLDAVAA